MNIKINMAMAIDLDLLDRQRQILWDLLELQPKGSPLLELLGLYNLATDIADTAYHKEYPDEHEAPPVQGEADIKAEELTG